MYIWIFGSLTVLYLVRRFFNGPKTPLKPNVEGKMILITGSSAGIGKETAFELLRNGAKVIFACRDEKKTMALINTLPEDQKKNSIFIKLDLCSVESADNFEKELRKKVEKIDIIINNAGLLKDFFDLTQDKVEEMFQANHLTHTYLTSKIIDLLSEKGKIINVSSMAHSFSKNIDFNELFNDLEFKNAPQRYSSFKEYGFSKLANVHYSITLAKYFEEKKLNFKAASLHPGAVLSEFLNRSKSTLMKIAINILKPFIIFFFKDSFMGAQTTLHLCYLEYNDFVSGGYYNNCKLSKTSDYARNEEARKNMMKYTLELAKLRFKNLNQNYIDTLSV